MTGERLGACQRCGLGYCVRFIRGHGALCPTCADEVRSSRPAKPKPDGASQPTSVSHSAWSCSICGPHPESTPTWCGAGCGRDYNRMEQIDDVSGPRVSSAIARPANSPLGPDSIEREK